MKPVRILITGGTLDKVHDPHAEALGFPPDGSSQIPDLLHYSRCHFPVLSCVLQMDSLDFTDTERAAILKAAQEARETALVITHGTGTMGDTARWLAARITGKTLVLTGAIRPHSLSRSDAAFNLGGAIVAAQCLPEGVYAVMNGRVIPAAEVQKDGETLRFDMQ